LKIVAPTDPVNRFLMLELTGCQDTKNPSGMVQSVSASETKTGFGHSMPPSGFAQDVERSRERRADRAFGRWIAQGAQNN
jgi:hypothetical protein